MASIALLVLERTLVQAGHIGDEGSEEEELGLVVENSMEMRVLSERG